MTVIALHFSTDFSHLSQCFVYVGVPPRDDSRGGEKGESNMSITSQHTPEHLFEEIFHLAHSTLLEMAEHIVGDRQHAEDIVQDVLLQAWQEGHADKCLARWENAVVARCQRVMEEEALLEYTGVHEEMNSAAWPVIEQAVSVDRTPTPVAIAFQSLPVRYRRVLELRFLEGLSFTETAQALHLPPFVLKQQMGAALRSMKRFLRESAQVEEWFTSTPLNLVR